MIWVTQGHENGIGLEIFLKAILCFNTNYQKQFTLIVNEDDLKSNLKNSNLKIDQFDIDFKFFECDNHLPHSTISLDLALGLCKPTDILLTLPTSKDQLYYNNNQVNGHTEYFRFHYKNPKINMAFLAHDSNFLLLTDHVAIGEITGLLTLEYIVEKVKLALTSFPDSRAIKEVFMAGINPHCGEGGLISKDDEILNKAIEILKNEYPNIIFHSPIAGDTIHFHIKDKSQLFIFPGHDQGLGIFKQRYGLTGINYTQGLPFKRVSVDHGTAFDLYGKNKADYIGMLYLLDEISTW